MLINLKKSEIPLLIDSLLSEHSVEKTTFSKILITFFSEHYLDGEIVISAKSLSIFLHSNHYYIKTLSYAIKDEISIELYQFAAFLCCCASIKMSNLQLAWSAATLNASIRLAQLKRTDTLHELCKRMRLYLTKNTSCYQWFWVEPDAKLEMQTAHKLINVTDKLSLLQTKIQLALHNLHHSDIETSYTTTKRNQITSLVDCFSIAAYLTAKEKKEHSKALPSHAVQLKLFKHYFDLTSSSNEAVINEDSHVLDDYIRKPKFFKNHNHITIEDAVESFNDDDFVLQTESTKKYDKTVFNEIALSFRAKRSMLFNSDTDILPISIYQALYQELQDVLETSIEAKERAIAALLTLSMLTSLSIEQLTVHQDSIERFFKKIDGKYYLTISLNITQLSAEKIKELDALRLNEHLTTQIQINARYIKEIKHASFIEADVKSVLSQLFKKLGLTYLTFSRIERTASVLLTRFIADRLNKDVLTNASSSECVQVYYSSFNPSELQTQHNHIESLLETNQLQPVQSINPQQFGTQIPPSFETAKNVLSMLHQQVLPKNFSIQNLNHYAVYIWHVFLVLTGARPTIGLGKRIHVDMHSKLIAVKDKNNRRVDNTRFVPMCEFLHDTLTTYFQYQEQFFMQHQFDKSFKGIDKLRSTHTDAYVLYVINQQRVQPARFAFIKNTLDVFQANWCRHLARSYFSLNDDALEHLVNTLFGHEKPYFECFGQFSSASMQHLKSMTEHFDALAERLGLKQVGSE